ncbi:class I adenylate-forming enzyme family protein [Sphingorhabdus sp.]|jgi:acyl-CoA synthetase (AMP-forming)/AMP-acid ligase II|uniref:class I adenylate-forming enzyme family protein n=1 Tax=Sphingorhabdus sp. TaxID=1902408 RepID=UPI00378484B3
MIEAGKKWTPPAGWPVMTRDQVKDALCAPGMPFEMETAEIEGVPTRVWKNALPNLAVLAAHANASFGDREFVVYEDERVTYAAWYRAVAALAHALQERGVKKGDRVALAMRNLPEWPVAFFAAAVTGAIVVPLNAWWTGEELAFGLADSGAAVLICDAERWDRISPYKKEMPALAHVMVTRAGAAAMAEPAITLESIIGSPKSYADLADLSLPEVAIAPDDAATIFYTSGTTGKPKGALGSHRNLLTNGFSSAYSGAATVLRRGDPLPEPSIRASLLVIPMFHVTACSASMIPTIQAGHKIVLLHKWDTVKAFEIIEREKINATGGVPFIAWQLIEHPDRAKYDLSSIDAISYGGAPSAPELVSKIYEIFGAFPGNGWGMTETMATVTSHVAEDYLNRPDSCGPAVAVSDVKIMSEDGSTELPVGEVGELWARGPQIVKGYWNRPDATAETFVDGWVRTGDLARVDDEGFCFIVDRAKDMIIRGGENIYSSEVENILYEHPAVTDAALIGIPHQTLGEEPAAVVHLAPGMTASEDELREYVSARLAKFKVPVKIIFTQDTLPRNANGKILKRDLKALF